MANRFLNVDYDKFANKTVTSMKDKYYVRAKAIRLNAMLRHVSMPDLDALVLDLDYDGLEWFFLRDGNLTININDVENIVLEPHESYTNTYTGYSDCHCVESVFYQLDQELLKKICDAKTIDFKISGATTYDIANGNSFIEYAQKFYNGFYDEEAYKDAVAEPEPKPSTPHTSASTSASSSGCMITLLMALGTLSSMVICACFIFGIL